MDGMESGLGGWTDGDTEVWMDTRRDGWSNDLDRVIDR